MTLVTEYMIVRLNNRVKVFLATADLDLLDHPGPIHGSRIPIHCCQAEAGKSLNGLRVKGVDCVVFFSVTKLVDDH